ncbi:leucine-rich repeat-containing protein 72 isoform X1 [Chiloscyllium punctatum]|uniref:leucine-rich repeat-containing protein 72 isoform X1 n=1 Tax=Chiloscyllium punctatum TaxID=137246 RepID=UPI003B63C812
MAAEEVIQNQLKLSKCKVKNDLIELYLANEGLTEVPNLSRFKWLKYLWLHHNKIKTINCLSMNYHIKELYLHNNLITDVTGALKHLTSLQILMLQNNWLHKVEKVISEFKKLRWLHTLNLFNNPLTQEQDYRLYVIYHVPSVQLLDRQLITQKERDAAFGTYCQDQFRVRQSLAFGQRKPYFTVQHISPKKTYKKYPGVLNQENKMIRELSEDIIGSQMRRRSIMQFSTLDWNKVPNAQQKRLADEPLYSSHIIVTQFR